MARSQHILLPIFAVIVTAGAILAQQTHAKPEDTVLAFAVAMKNRDFKAMAAMVVGGKAEFDYTKFLGDDPELNQVYTSFRAKILKATVTGNDAQVICDLDYSTKGGGGGGQKGEKVPLRLEDASWKIVPYTKRSPTGYFFESFANKLVHPEETVAGIEAYYGPTRNKTAQTIKLGRERSKFFEKVLAVPDRSQTDYFPYSGYKSMMMVEHTTVLWPVGKSDEVIFHYTNEGFGRLTRWRLVRGHLERMWQATLPEKGRKGTKLKAGTLASWLTQDGGRLPTRMPKDMRETLGKVQPYAAYRETGAIGIFTCWVIFKDGSERPEMNHLGEHSIGQDSDQLMRKGFYITPDEVALLRARRQDAQAGRPGTRMRRP